MVVSSPDFEIKLRCASGNSLAGYPIRRYERYVAECKYVCTTIYPFREMRDAIKNIYGLFQV